MVGRKRVHSDELMTLALTEFEVYRLVGGPRNIARRHGIGQSTLWRAVRGEAHKRARYGASTEVIEGVRTMLRGLSQSPYPGDEPDGQSDCGNSRGLPWPWGK